MHLFNLNYFRGMKKGHFCLSLLFFSLVTCLFVACDNDDDSSKPLYGRLPNEVSLVVRNAQGEDLLDTKVEGNLWNNEVSFECNGKKLVLKDDEFPNHKEYYIEDGSDKRYGVAVDAAYVSSNSLNYPGRIYGFGSVFQDTKGNEIELVIDWGNGDKDRLFIKVTDTKESSKDNMGYITSIRTADGKTLEKEDSFDVFWLFVLEK